MVNRRAAQKALEHIPTDGLLQQQLYANHLSSVDEKQI